jgi:flagellar biosynthesis/type III secretory pathway protein FliH
MITRGRIVKGAFPSDAPSTSTVDTARAIPVSRARARRIDGVIVDAYGEAAQIVAGANARAEAALEGARARALHDAEAAAKDAREAAVAKLAAGFLALRAAEEKRADRELAQTTELAKMLAERLLGEALRLDGARIADLARAALAEARGARRAKIRASAEDATVHAARLDELGMPKGTVEVVVDDTLTRGSLLLDTDLGVLDARLAPQLDRLTETLRDVLRTA